MIKPEPTPTIRKSDAELLNVIAQQNGSSQDEERMLGTLAALIFAEARNDRNGVEVIVQQLSAHEGYLAYEKLNVLGLRIATLAIYGTLNNRVGGEKNETATIKGDIKESVQEKLPKQLEHLVNLYENEPHETAGSKEAIANLVVETVDLARHLDVNEPTWLAICSAVGESEELTNQTFISVLPPIGLAKKYSIPA